MARARMSVGRGVTSTGDRRFFSRELSWLEFNYRVLEEAMDCRHPLLERAKFLAIFHSNLDEFFMVRVSGLKEQVESGMLEPSDDGLTPPEQLAMIRERALAYQDLAAAVWSRDLCPLLGEHGVRLCALNELTDTERRALDSYFLTTAYPVLTPLAVDPTLRFPHISNLSLSLAVALRTADGAERFARVKIPQVLPRLLPVPDMGNGDSTGPRAREAKLVWLEDLIGANLGQLFRGLTVVGCYAFRVIRDADLEIREDEAGDLLQRIERSLVRRRFGSVTRLVVESRMPSRVRQLLMHHLEAGPEDVYETAGPLGLSDLMALCDLDRPDLKDRPFQPVVPPVFRTAPDVFAAIRAGDILLHHPYDSFDPVVEFVRAAAADPDVLAIKQTIYRVGSKSPIVEALAQASLNGKQVSVLVELKARFDEENNIEWARALERVGAHVVYGDMTMKTHCKVLFVVRREPDAIRRYVHLGTGNYNARTARLYTDLGIFTCDPDIAEDVTALFNSLTGYSVQSEYRKLLVSPRSIRKGLLERIDREIEHAREGRGGRIILKMNSLTDSRSVEALYRASEAGVKVDLIIRASCCLVPGVPGLSENIRVISIVGRFLEHHRLYYFRNGGGAADEVWLGSADMMQRNLDRRVETLFPVDDPGIRRWLVDGVLGAYLRDTVQARQLLPDGRYERIAPPDGASLFDSQAHFLVAGPSAKPRARRKARKAARAGG
ncbi:MAG TPA: polyphosphate kinase 1 [Chthonomonadales bacterium]|nr:polyphosphate kinase 1 [Chthonomonadales bacterium]